MLMETLQGPGRCQPNFLPNPGPPDAFRMLPAGLLMPVPTPPATHPQCRAAGTEEPLHPRYFPALVKNKIIYPSSCRVIWKRYKWVAGGQGAGKCRWSPGHLVPDTRSKEHQPFQAKKMKSDLVIPISVK